MKTGLDLVDSETQSAMISQKKKTAKWHVLRPSLVATLEVALVLAGRYGQVHLVMEGGGVRYIRTLCAEEKAGRG